MDEKDIADECGPVNEVGGGDDAAFERQLETLLLRAFGDGNEVEGVWDLEYEPDEIPDWTVTIDRKDRF